ncbi:hypothetical protein FPK44_22725, partial [Acinetobacter baumannii]
LKQIYQLPSDMKGKIFEYINTNSISDVFRTLEACRWNDGVSFIIKMKAQDSRDKKYDTKRKIFSLKYNIPEKKSQLLAILSGLQPRQDN